MNCKNCKKQGCSLAGKNHEMSLEELVEKLVDYSYCPPGTACKPTCKECWLSWFKAVADTEEDL